MNRSEYLDENRDNNYKVIKYDNGKTHVPTDTERAIIMVMTDPELIGTTTSEKIEKSGYSRKTFYKHLARPEFRKMLNEVMLDAMKGYLSTKVGDVIQAMYKFGTENAKNHSDRMAILKLLEMYSDKKEINVNKKSVSASVEWTKTATDEELKDIAKQIIKDNPELIEG